MEQLRIFACPNYGGHLRLTVSACAEQWGLARKARPSDRLYPCRGCPIGARHSGLSDAEAERAQIGAAASKQRSCVRCGRHPHRLQFGVLCVSCYNRARESLCGANGKGTFPQYGPRLHKFYARFVLGGRTYRASTVAETFAQFVTIILRHFPLAEILWPGNGRACVMPVERTRSRALVRPFELMVDGLERHACRSLPMVYTPRRAVPSSGQRAVTI
jgi:hypothetical protein